MQKVIIIDDQPEIQRLVKTLLEARYELLVAANGAEAIQLLSRTPVDLILLDVGLPDENGFHLISKLKALPGMKETPVVFLTGKSEVGDRVTGFALGADDYIVKPFEPLEFRARIEAKMLTLFQKSQAATEFRKGNLILDQTRFRAFYETTPGARDHLDLTPHEFRLLLHFAKHAEQVLSRDQLMTAVWGAEVHVLERTIDRHVSALRKKIPAGAVQIEAVHGMGYRFVMGTAAASGQRAA